MGFSKKRFAVGAMACVMAMSMLSIPAMAANYDGTPVMGKYVEGATAAPVISAGIKAPEEITLVYSTGSKGTWDPKTHTYTGGSEEGQWSVEGDNTITVTNHSNVAVTVTPTYKAEAAYEDVKVGFSKASFTLATAEGTAVAEAPSDSFTVGIAGKNTATLDAGDNGQKLGTINVKIAAAE